MADPELVGRGAIAYFRAAPDAEFWSRHWSAEDLDHLLAVAEVSPLTRFIERHVRPGDRVLEGGCGLGQYVRYFGERGARIIGVDFSREAVDAHCRQFPDSDLRVADLAQLPLADESFDVVLSLGVIEHYGDGGGAVLREARRVLAPDGVLVLSTPYLSVSRRALRRRITGRQEERRRSGAEFYQYAFSERQLDALLDAAGFAVRERSYYDPGRGLRDLHALIRGGDFARAGPAPVKAGAHAPRAHGPLKRRVLYAKPTLKTLAHMQVVAAHRTR